VIGRRELAAALAGLALVGAVLPAVARDGGAAAAGSFDYYVMSLSWSPQYCAESTGRVDSQQCGSRKYGFVLHGLWPQYLRGSPEFCATDQPHRVKPQIVERYLPIMPSPKLIEHEWTRHGTCSGLSQEQYFAMAGRAFEDFRVPKEFDEGRLVATDSRTILAKLRVSNPRVPEQAIVLRCRGKDLSEVRICLSKDLAPIACGADIRGGCPREEVRVRPIR
jgi:ribonuclease T2